MNSNDYKAIFAQVRSARSADPNRLEVILMKKSTRTIHRRPILIAAAIALAVLLSVSAYAIVTLLSPAQVAREIGDNALAAAFENGKGTLIDESVTSHGYILTLHGMTSGKNLSDFCPDADAEQTAVVFSVRRENGRAVGSDIANNGVPFTSAVFFSGYKPWMFSSFMLGMGASAFEKDGVYYMVLNIDDSIEMLADRAVTFGIWDFDLGFAPGSALLRMKEDGTISFVDGLQKAHAMFTLPLDPAKADPARVARILEELGYSEADIAFMRDPNAVPPDGGIPDETAPAADEAVLFGWSEARD